MSDQGQHQQADAGWYPNPQGEGDAYWDGSQWTDRRRDAWGTETGNVAADVYEVDVIKQRFLSGTLDRRRLQNGLNQRAAEGWKLVRTVTSESRVLLFFKRESVYLIFERA